MATKTVFLTGAAFFVPADFDPAGPWTLGGLGGGGGGRRGNSQSGGGGGGSSYSQITQADATLIVGRVLLLSIGAAGSGATVVNTNGTSGGDTWVNLAGVNSAPATTAAGFLAKAGAGGTASGGAGGLASASVGSTKNDGGTGGGGANAITRGGSGGGGAGGFNGPGGTGGAVGITAGGGAGGGGSGGGGSGTGGAAGIASTIGSGTNGGANSAGVGAGVAPSGAGTLGGGGGGADAAVTPAAAGIGGAGADWMQTSDSTTAGPGGGGGGGGNATGANTGGNGGAAGGYGAGGGGCGGSTAGTNAAGNGGNGSAGFAFFTYTIAASSASGGGSSAPFTLNLSVGGGLGFAPGSSGLALGALRPPSATFTPDQISGLVFAIRSDAGITLNAGSIVGAAPAWGTTIGAFGTGATAPTQAAAFGPNGQDLFQFTSGSAQFFSLASDVTVGACTVFWLYAPTVINANKQLFANASNTSYIRSNTAGASSVSVMAVLTVGGANTNISLTAGIRPYRNMLPTAVTYDPAASGGTASVYVNNILAGSATSVGAGGFLFNRIGVLGAATNPYDGYMGPALIYNRVLSLQEMANVMNYLIAWRGQNLYVSVSGDDSSVTPWNRTTPLLTPQAGAALPFTGFETIAPKGGDLFRMTQQMNSLTAGMSPSVRLSVNGSIWGTGKAKIYGSTAPNVLLISGTVYDCGAFGSTPSHYVHYIPGGTIAFGANYTLGNMQRLVEDVSTPATPAIGKWGYTGGHVYVNTGVALNNGDIEVTLATSLVAVISSAANWNFRNFIVAFSNGTCLGNGDPYHTVDGVECYFSGADGIDATGPIVGMEIKNCIVAYMGSGPAGTGASAGDSYSMHASTVATITNCQSWWSDKGCFNHIGDCTVTHDRCIAVGSLCFRNSSGSGGALTVTNSIAVVAANAFSDDAITAGSASDTDIIENCTIVSLKGAGSGINQALAGGNLTALNNIITGFTTGLTWMAGGTLSMDYNDYYVNTSNYSGTSAGAHDLAVNPQFVNASAFNYALGSSSPCLGAGVFISGITVDLVGTARPNPPAIGAYQVGIAGSFRIRLENGSGFVTLENGSGYVLLEATS